MKKMTQRLLTLLLMFCLCVPMTAMATTTYYYLEVSIEEDMPDGKITEENRWTGTSPSYLTEDELLMPLIIQAINENYTSGDQSSELYIFDSPAMKRIMDEGLKAYAEGADAWKEYQEKYYEDIHNLDKNLPLKELLTADGTTIGELELNKEYKISFKNTVEGDDKYGITYIVTVVRKGYNYNAGGSGSGGSGSGGSGGSSDKDETPDIADPDETGVSNYLITDVHDAFMVGDDKGTFRPNANITRAEAAQVFYNLLKNKNVAVTVDFDDVAEDAWYAAAVNTLGSMGIVNGVGDNKFEPQRAITRAEFAAIAVRFTEKTVSGYDFDDVPKDHWAYTAISTAAAYGWVNGISEDQFAPDRNITRAEVAKIVNHMLGRLGDQEEIDSGAGRAFPDVTKSHWAWYEIAEATTDHDCKFNASRTEETWKK